MMRIQNQVILINQQTITGCFLDTVFTQSCQVGAFFITFLKYMNCSQFMVTAKAKAELVPAFCLLKHSVFPPLQVIRTGYRLYFNFNVTHECNNSAIQHLLKKTHSLYVFWAKTYCVLGLIGFCFGPNHLAFWAKTQRGDLRFVWKRSAFCHKTADVLIQNGKRFDTKRWACLVLAGANEQARVEK